MTGGRVLDERELTGRAESHLVELPGGGYLQAPAAAALAALQADAERAGFKLAIASAYRSFDRQRVIFNGKLAGERATYADSGERVDIAALPRKLALEAVLRYSAMPGTSRHHWGTDLDVYDAAAVPADYRVQLSPDEVAPDGVFGPLHDWLDRRMAADSSHGYFRPYASDRGGVAPERWHLSYAPLATTCAARLTAPVVLRSWDEAGGVSWRDEIDARLGELLERYVAVPPGWCPAPG